MNSFKYKVKEHVIYNNTEYVVLIKLQLLGCNYYYIQKNPRTNNDSLYPTLLLVKESDIKRKDIGECLNYLMSIR